MSIYRYTALSADGRPVELAAYRGQTLLVVNTASKCSYARQFDGLQTLYDRYRERGFAVLAFPCNQFNGKEPGSDAQVKAHCALNGWTFPLFAKLDVRGASAHSLFAYLAEQAPFLGYGDDEEGRRMRRFLQETYPDLYDGNGVKWNFTKFLIGRDGRAAARYETTVEPAAIAPAIERLL